MLEIRPATSDEELAHVARIVTTVTPDNPMSVDEMRWQEEKYPGLWGNISVLPEHRRRGVGAGILAAIADVARGAGKTMLVGRTTADRVEAIEFLEAVETANDTDNAPMRAVNQRLGYRPLPDEVYFRGPVTLAPVAPE